MRNSGWCTLEKDKTREELEKKIEKAKNSRMNRAEGADSHAISLKPEESVKKVRAKDHVYKS